MQLATDAVSNSLEAYMRDPGRIVEVAQGQPRPCWEQMAGATGQREIQPGQWLCQHSAG